MHLTRRQEQFVSMMITLRQEFDGPVRYAVLAERLGVSPFTAYDMLCLLEEKGYVTSVYQLPNDKSGPGRAERVFFPGPMAFDHEKRIAEETGGRLLEGEALQQYVLDKMRQGKTPPEDKDLAYQLMARLSAAGQDDVRYCVEVMTIAVLRLQRTPGQQALLEHLPHLLPKPGAACQAHLCLLGGFVFGLLAQQSVPGQEWLAKLREYMPGYVDVVMRLDQQDCARLVNELASLFAVLGEGQ